MAPTYHGVLFYESNSSNDWVAAGGPSNINEGSLGTLWTNFAYLKGLEAKWSITNEINYKSMPGGFGLAIPTDLITDLRPFTGFLNSSDDFNSFQTFFRKHCKYTDERLYMMIRRGTSDYRTFVDYNRNDLDYAPGYIIRAEGVDDAEQPGYFEIQGVFQVVHA